MERTKRVQVYVSADEQRAIRLAAAHRDCSMSDYMRDCWNQASAGRQWLRAYHLACQAVPRVPRAAELLLSEASALLLDGYESEFDHLDDDWHIAYAVFVRAANSDRPLSVDILPI